MRHRLNLFFRTNPHYLFFVHTLSSCLTTTANVRKRRSFCSPPVQGTWFSFLLRSPIGLQTSFTTTKAFYLLHHIYRSSFFDHFIRKEQLFYRCEHVYRGGRIRTSRRQQHGEPLLLLPLFFTSFCDSHFVNMLTSHIQSFRCLHSSQALLLRRPPPIHGA